MSKFYLFFLNKLNLNSKAKKQFKKEVKPEKNNNEFKFFNSHLNLIFKIKINRKSFKRKRIRVFFKDCKLIIYLLWFFILNVILPFENKTKKFKHENILVLI